MLCSSIHMDRSGKPKSEEKEEGKTRSGERQDLEKHTDGDEHRTSISSTAGSNMQIYVKMEATT